MRAIFILALFILSTFEIAQAEVRYNCQAKNVSGSIELDSLHTIVIAARHAYLDVQTHTISLVKLEIGSKQTSIYFGKDTDFSYAFYSQSKVLSILGHHSENAPINFNCPESLH